MFIMKKMTRKIMIASGTCLIAVVIALYGTGTKKPTRQIQKSYLDQYENLVPVVIIGTGPAGLGAALHTARDNKQPIAITGDEPGGLLTKTGEVENWLGVPTVKGEAAVAMAADQAAQYGAVFLHDTVEKVDLSEWPFAVHTFNDLTLRALTIVIATGARPRMLDIPGEAESWGSGLSTCALCDAWAYKNAQDTILVVGGGDSAVEEAIQLAQHASSITIAVRSNRMRASAQSQERLKKYPSIKVMYNTMVEEIIRGVPQSEDLDDEEEMNERIIGVRLRNTASNTEEYLPVAGVFLAIGHIPNSELFTGQVAMDSEGYITTEGRTQATSVSGVFVAGDVADPRYRQATYAAGMGVAAGIDACRYLDESGFTPEIAMTLRKGHSWQTLTEITTKILFFH
jgi:thioredoxin reductase (NADPH)